MLLIALAIRAVADGAVVSYIDAITGKRIGPFRWKSGYD
jgi:hypothetical protein